MQCLDLESIKNGLPTLTPEWGAFLSQSALYCLQENNHRTGVILKLVHCDEKEAQIVWTVKLDLRAQSSFGDKDEAVEYGATCIAILLAVKLTKFPTVQRSCKGTGFDYWLGYPPTENELPFQKVSRLEISGIFRGDERNFTARIQRKKLQTSSSDSTNLPAIISVIEFSHPMASFVQK